MATAKHRAHRPPAPQQAASSASTSELGRELEAQRRRRAPRPRRRARRRHRRRPAAADLHRVPSGALDRGARRAHAAPARRPDDRRDRARVPRARADDRAAHRARQAHARRGARAVRGAARRRARARASPRCSRSSTSIFNEGYSATAGDDWMRPALCEDALRLGRILAELAPDEPEVHGLVALMEIQASRAAARASARRASRSCCSTRTARAGTSC